jgi:hypothetical protein
VAAFMALLWLKPLAARAVKNEQSEAIADAAPAVKARGVGAM